MYGAILGDMIGAPYEFDRGNKTKDFPLFSRRSEFTDDSVMTIAVAEALMNCRIWREVLPLAESKASGAIRQLWKRLRYAGIFCRLAV